MAENEGIRLQKVLAQAGLGSRRACEELIAEGRVSINGEIVSSQGRRVDPSNDLIEVDGVKISKGFTPVVLMMNKPSGVVTTMKKTDDRVTVGEFVEGRKERLFHVGRLDQDTEGLLLLTNDGALGHGLTHPSIGVAKVYLARIRGQIRPNHLRILQEGVELSDGFARASSAKLVASTASDSLVEITIHEGRNRIVRRMIEFLGLDLLQLVRTQFGPIKLGEMKPGKSRLLSEVEVKSLYQAISDSKKRTAS
jgi:23S rRNA pseudouridine2605 synthase